MRNQNNAPASDGERSASAQAWATIISSKITARATIMVALLSLLTAGITLFKPNDSKPQEVNNSPCSSLNAENASIGSINCSTSIDAEKPTNFNLKVQTLSGTDLKSVSFYKDDNRQESLPFDYQGGIYKLRFNLKRSDSVDVYIKANNYDPKKISLTPDDVNPLPFKLSYDCDNGENRKKEGDCKTPGGKQ